MKLDESEPLAVETIGAIRAGHVEELRRLLADNPGLAAAVIQRGDYSYPLIGAATDWPGHFPRVAEAIEALVSAGADVNARASGPHRETALHGAASSDDVGALDALLDAGADIEADGAVIAGGTALDDAVAFGQWKAARGLVERGAEAAVWHAAALGLIDRVRAYLDAGGPAPRYPWGGDAGARAIDVAFWCACHGGQRGAAVLLHAAGADASWRAPWDGLTPLGAARRSGASEVIDWLESLRAAE